MFFAPVREKWLAQAIFRDSLEPAPLVDYFTPLPQPILEKTTIHIRDWVALFPPGLPPAIVLSFWNYHDRYNGNYLKYLLKAARTAKTNQIETFEVQASAQTPLIYSFDQGHRHLRL